jgi:hypothetical protein
MGLKFVLVVLTVVESAGALCPAGSYQPALKASCLPCPANSNSQAGATACTVDPGYYDLGAKLMGYYPFNPENLTADISEKIGPLGNNQNINTVTVGWSTPWSSVEGASAAYFSEPVATQKLTLPEITFPSAFTVCFWYYPLAGLRWTTLVDFNYVIWIYQRGAPEVNFFVQNKVYSPNQDGMVYSLVFHTADTTFRLNQWSHMCLIVSQTMYNHVYNGQARGFADPLTFDQKYRYRSKTSSQNCFGCTHKRADDVELQNVANNNFRGYMDDIRIYSTALTIEEAAAVYNFRGDTYTTVMPIQCQPGTCADCQPGTYTLDGGCVACPINTYSDTINSPVCLTCPAGSFAMNPGQPQCTGCAAGKYSASNTCESCSSGTYFTGTGATKCDLCSYGKYSIGTGLTDSSTCTFCEAGKYKADPNNGESSCTSCSVGTYNTGVGNMIGADFTIYPHPDLEDHTKILNPVSGYYCEGYQSSNSVNVYYYQESRMCFVNSKTEFHCPFFQGSNCYKTAEYYDPDKRQNMVSYYCGIGCYKAKMCENKYNGQFVVRPFNGVTDAANNSCPIICDPGFILSQDNYCVPKPPCQTCSVGTYTMATGSSVCASCPSCPIGQYNPSCTPTDPGSCVPCSSCPAGYYSPACFATDPLLKTVATTPCLPCPAGMYSAADSSSCTFCPAGKYTLSDTDRTCVSCMAGMFSNRLGASASSTCTVCPSGTYSASGSSVCSSCQPGTYVNGPSSCVPCLEGTYSGQTGASSSAACQACPVGKFANGTGFSVCADCQAGTYSLNTSSCALCWAGTYSTTVGARTSATCTHCSLGMYSSGVGIPTSSACQLCQAGTYASAPGQGSACTLCPAGKFNTVNGVFEGLATPAPALAPYSSRDAPVAKTTGYYCSFYQPYQTIEVTGGELQTLGPIYTAACYPGGSGKSVTPGICAWRRDINSWGPFYCRNAVANCVSNQYLQTFCTTGSLECVNGCITASPCTNGANGVFVPPTSSTFDGVTDVTPDSCPIVCNPGFVLQNNYCVPVPPCETCPADKYSAPGETVCTTCVVCNTGFYSIGCQGGKQGVCTPCPVCSDDLYGVGCGGSSPGTCTCKPGTYALNMGSSSSLACAACQAGTYSVTAGASTPDTCTLCPIGTYATGTGMASSDACLLCPAGTYSVLDVVRKCAACPAGTFSATTGATASSTCALCGLGTYSAAKASVCAKCAAGSYASAPSGATECTACAAGTYSTILGNGVGAPSASVGGTQQQSYYNSIPRQPGYYCSTFQQGFAGTVTTTSSALDDGYLPKYVCRYLSETGYGWVWYEQTQYGDKLIQPGRCLWAYDSSYCPPPVYSGRKYATFQCLPGCLVATPCVNGANGTYLSTPSTYDGVNDITPNSCPVQCNPGFMLRDNYCVPQPPCTQCPECDNGFYPTVCGGSTPGECNRCTNI